MSENASVGDSWKLGPLPDPKVASFISAEYESEGGEDVTGGGGARYFVFNAKQRGTVVVTVSNCWRCGAAGFPPTSRAGASRGCDLPDHRGVSRARATPGMPGLLDSRGNRECWWA
nr:hypothetical protein GCM10020093_003050 [Planobispora longispora]